MSELSTPYFYYVEDEYINFLKKKEIEKRNFTRVPNVHYWNTKKFVFGAVLEINNMLYFAPVTSYAKSQEDLILLRDKKDNKILGSIRFNYMIPVPKQCLHKLEIKSLPTEKSRVHTSKELSFCRRKRDNIYKTALKTYKRVTEKKNEELVANSCDFNLLEQAYQEYCNNKRFFVNSWGNPKNEIKIFNKRQKIKLSLVFLIDRQTYVKYDCENA
jgi:protein AbiQ